MRMSTTTPLAEGLVKTVIQKGNGPPLKFGDIATVKYNCYILNKNDAPNTMFSESNKQKVVVGNGIMIEGWERGLSSMIVGEKSVIRVEDTSLYGYGSEGVPPIIPGDAVLELELEVLDREDAPTMGTAGAAAGLMSNRGGADVSGFFAGGSGDFGALDPSKPRTPESIAAAYKERQDAQALIETVPKEGIAGFIEKAKTFYFFGLFEGETGEKPPWFLQPNITFPIVFAIVGLALWVTVLGGGISERGIPVTDELDTIILN